MYRYETHCHTAPVSRCARASVRQTLEFYQRIGYDGIFITNHFLDENLNIDKDLPYEERLAFYLTDYEEAKKIGEEIGFTVLFAVEMSYGGSDFLIYGLTPEWYFAHPEIMQMKRSDELAFLASEGALVIQAHPFRSPSYLDHIRLFHKQIEGVEVINAGNNERENAAAEWCADFYGFLKTAGSDNHVAEMARTLAGIETEERIRTVEDFIRLVREKKTKIFMIPNPEREEPEGSEEK